MAKGIWQRTRGAVVANAVTDSASSDPTNAVCFRHQQQHKTSGPFNSEGLLMVSSAVPSFLFTVLLATGVAAQDGPIRVHVFTAVDPSGFTDQNGRDRTDAVKDVRVSIAKMKGVVVAPTSIDADVTFEITRRVKEMAKTSMSKSMWKNNSWSRSPDSMQPFLYGTVTVGTFTTELRGAEPDSEHHGGNLAKAFEQWLRENRAQLLQQRQKR